MSAVHATCGRVGSDSTKPDMQALAAQARGTDIVTELRWHVLSSYGPPCSDRSVLCIADGTWCTGYHDAVNGWVDCESGATLEGVTRDQGAIARAAVGAA